MLPDLEKNRPDTAGIPKKNIGPTGRACGCASGPSAAAMGTQFRGGAGGWVAQWLSDDLQRLPTRFAYSGASGCPSVYRDARSGGQNLPAAENTRALYWSKTAASWARHSLVRQARNPPKPPAVNHIKPDGSSSESGADRKAMRDAP